MKTSYQEFQPCPALRPFVECYWLHEFEVSGMQDSPVQRCMPFGALELILHLDDNCAHVMREGIWQKLPRAFLVGLYRETVHWKAVGSGRKFGIRLKPEALIQLFRIPVGAMFNQYTDLDSFFGKGVNKLIDDVYSVPEIADVISYTEKFLTQHFSNLSTERTYLAEATRMIRQAKGNVSIEVLSEQLNISKRQLERGFKDAYGTSPKLYQRIVRFRNAYESFQQTSTAPNWLDVSYNFGYADQAHFIRDFKEFSDDVPTLVYHDSSQYFRIPVRRLVSA